MRVNVEKSKFRVVGKDRTAPLLEVEIKGGIMEVFSSFKYLGSCFSKDGGPHEDLKMRVSMD